MNQKTTGKPFASCLNRSYRPVSPDTDKSTIEPPEVDVICPMYPSGRGLAEKPPVNGVTAENRYNARMARSLGCNACNYGLISYDKSCTTTNSDGVTTTVVEFRSPEGG